MKKNRFHLTSIMGVWGALVLSTGILANPKTTFAAQAKIILTPSERQIRAIALSHHDQNYIMVDKREGRLIVFEEGKPIFIAAVLTGVSRADIIPAATFHLSLKQHQRKDKVTPAGRFTVSREGKRFIFNEISADLWVEAIHVCGPAVCKALNRGAEHSHKTLGCVNVDPQTMKFLLKRLGDRVNTPTYIMPQNTGDISTYFPSLPDQPSILSSLKPIS